MKRDTCLAGGALCGILALALLLLAGVMWLFRS